MAWAVLVKQRAPLVCGTPGHRPVDQSLGEEESVSCLVGWLYHVRCGSLEATHLRWNALEEVTLMCAGDAGKTAVTLGGRRQEESHDTKTIPHHAIPILVPVVAFVPLAPMQGPALVALVHEDAVVMIQAKLAIDELGQIRQDPGMVDQPS